jgi:hypothetical protein
MIMFSELERIWEETLIAFFKVFWHIPGKRENHEKPQSRHLIYWQRFKPSTS